jgi:hypothetical protein
MTFRFLRERQAYFEKQFVCICEFYLSVPCLFWDPLCKSVPLRHTFNPYWLMINYHWILWDHFTIKKYPTSRKAFQWIYTNIEFSPTERRRKQAKGSENNCCLHWNFCDNKRYSVGGLLRKERTPPNRRTNNDMDLWQTIGTKTTVISFFHCFNFSFIDSHSIKSLSHFLWLDGYSARVSVLDRLDQLPVNEGTKIFAVLCMVYVTRQTFRSFINLLSC